jgi:hypothetical protein
MKNTYNYRKERFSMIKNQWGLDQIHDLFMSHTPPQNLLNDLKFSVMLYISKAFYFEFTDDEDLFIERLNQNRSIRDNITPNGAIVPKKEYQLEYNMVLRSWSKIVKNITKNNPNLLKKFRMTPNIRIKFGIELEENIGRLLNTSYPHSDAWVEGPWGMNCYTPLLGDIENNNLVFWTPKNTSEFKDEFLSTATTYKEMQWVLDYYEFSPELTPKKGKVHISDYALIHATNRELSCNTRVSIDTTIFVGDHEVHMDREAEYLDDIKIIGEDILVSSNRSINEESIIDKKSIFSHYTTGTLTFHNC